MIQTKGFSCNSSVCAGQRLHALVGRGHGRRLDAPGLDRQAPSDGWEHMEGLMFSFLVIFWNQPEAPVDTLTDRRSEPGWSWNHVTPLAGFGLTTGGGQRAVVTVLINLENSLSVSLYRLVRFCCSFRSLLPICFCFFYFPYSAATRRVHVNMGTSITPARVCTLRTWMY